MDDMEKKGLRIRTCKNTVDLCSLVCGLWNNLVLLVVDYIVRSDVFDDEGNHKRVFHVH